VILPYIPDDFVTQKRSKRGTMVRKTRGTVKKMKQEVDERKQAQYSGKKRKYVGWVTEVLSSETDLAADGGIDGFRLKAYIAEKIEEFEDSILEVVTNPFADCMCIADIENSVEKKIALDTVVRFMFHYNRSVLH
jgi:hypothetical protein